MTELTAGMNAPDFTLPSDTMGDVRLSDLNGQNVVLFFYPKDNTSGCTTESIAFSAAKADFDALNTVVIGISPDSVTSHEKFRAKHDLTVPLLADEDKNMLEAYGVWKEKSMYGRTYMGVERTTVLIDSAGKIVEIWRKVKVKDHVDAVLAATKALAGKA